MASDPDKIRESYKRWWLGKMCRARNQNHREFKLVIDIKIIGPPSLFNCVVELTYHDSSTELVPMGVRAFRPRKCDMEVKPLLENTLPSSTIATHQ